MEGFLMMIDGSNWEKYAETIDDKRDLVVAKDKAEAIAFSVDHFIALSKEAINDHGYFAVALSGGSTPKAIFEGLSGNEKKGQVDWQKVMLFWSDERAVLSTDKDSNYKMAMDAGF